MADLSTEAAGGNGVFIGEAVRVDLQADGYIEHEYVAAGTATSYQATWPCQSECCRLTVGVAWPNSHWSTRSCGR